MLASSVIRRAIDILPCGAYSFDVNEGIHMKRVMTIVVLAVALLGCTRQDESREADVSGVVNYTFEPEPEGISTKLYNWELMLSEEDSRSATWTIVQVTQPLVDKPQPAAAVTETLIDSEMIVPNQDGHIHFKLHAGEKEPTPNMNGPGNVGHPVIFSGIGTGKGASNWIVLPGSEITEVIPSKTGTRPVDGALRIIRFIGVDAAGARFQSDVILRHE